jgi:hypothetical protein
MSGVFRGKTISSGNSARNAQRHRTPLNNRVQRLNRPTLARPASGVI